MQYQEQDTIYLGCARVVGSRIGIGTWAIGGGWGPQPNAILHLPIKPPFRKRY